MRQLMIYSAFVVFFASDLAHASPIHITFSGDATGSIGANTGTAPVTFSFDADTSNIYSPFAGVYGYNAVASTIDVTGVGTFTLTGQFYVFNNASYGIAGFGLNDDMLDISNPSLETYGFTTAFGPVTGNVENLSINSVDTSGGSLTITNFSNVTFQVTVPEPSSFTLLSLALVGTIGIVRRKRPR